MFTTAGIIFVLLIVGSVFLFLARRILRIALKLAFAMAIIFMLIVGAGFGWWRGWFDSGTRAHATPTTTNTRAAPTNRRR
jgi:multisubunit Na+/H+ antiporter MnhC subunit